MEAHESCKACSRNDTISNAISICIDCNEGLCQFCSEAHRINKRTLLHSLVSADVIAALKFVLANPDEKCQKHTEFLKDLVCTTHDVVVCRKCMLETHRQCEHVLPIELASGIIKRSTQKSKLLNEINQLREAGNKVVDFGGKNHENVQKQNQTILKDIAGIRSTYMSKLEEVENYITGDLKQKLQNNVSVIDDYKKELQTLKDAASIYRQEMDFIKSQASENKAFLLIERLKRDLQKDTKEMKKVSSKIENAKLDYVYSADYDVRTLGRVTVNNSSCPVKYIPVSRVLTQSLDYSEVNGHQLPEVVQNEEDEDDRMAYEDIDEVARSVKMSKEPSYVVAAGPVIASDVELVTCLSKGKMKEVWKATWKTKNDIVVKKVKSSLNAISVDRLTGLAHNNIALFIGSYVEEGRTCLVFEFAHGGDLLNYLRKKTKTYQETELISISAQIARGMSFLESKDIIHCCLQSKRILIGDIENFEIKISGLEYTPVKKVVAIYPYTAANDDELTFNKDDVIQVLDTEDANWWEGQLGGNEGVFPVNYVQTPQWSINLDERVMKWYAPETLRSSACNVKSNVWSFGIVLYEIFSSGQTPFGGIQNSQLLARLTQGFRPPKPRDCSEAIYGVMTQCLHEYPDDRPTFEYLRNFLEDIIFGF